MPDGLDCRGDIGVGGEHDDDQARPQCEQPAQDLKAVVGAEAEVQEHNLELLFLDRLERARGIRRLKTAVNGRQPRRQSECFFRIGASSSMINTRIAS